VGDRQGFLHAPGVEALHFPRQHAEACDALGFVAALEEGLEAQADAQKGSLTGQVALERGHIALLLQNLHHAAEGPHPGEDQLFGVVYIRLGGANPYGLAQLFDGVDDAANVAGAIVEQSNHSSFLRSGVACQDSNTGVHSFISI